MGVPALPPDMTTWEPYAPLPKGIVRDLLAVTRLLYRQTSEQDRRDVVRLQQLEDIGKAYRQALKLCANPEHRGTNPYFDGWELAEKATKALCMLLESDARLAEAAKAAALKVKMRRGIPGKYGTG